MNYTTDEVRGHHDLDQVAADMLGAPNHKAMLDKYLPNKNSSYELIPKGVLYEYAAKDVTKTLQISSVLHKRVTQDSLNKKLYERLLIPATELLSKIEGRGIYIDQDKVQENFTYYEKLKEKLQEELNELARKFGYPSGVNANSPKQVSAFLYEFLGLGSASLGTGKDILEKLDPHPAIAKILEFRKASKSFGTYVKPYPTLMTSEGRIHASYKLYGTPTGRLASSDPNLQNIPRDPRLRNQFKATPGFIMYSKDYDQAELRCLADRSGDKELCKIYNTKGMSLHKEVSVSLWGEKWLTIYTDPEHEEKKTPEWLETKEQYMRTKALNFGIVYGRTAISIALEFNIALEEAQAMIDGWAERFPEAWTFIQNCRLAPVRGMNLKTPFGNRKRAQLSSRDNIQSLMNEASNFPHQAIASHCTLKSASILQPILEERNVFIINLIHDDILTELPDGDPELLKWTDATMSKVMQQAPLDYGIDKVPFLTDGKAGYNWGSLG